MKLFKCLGVLFCVIVFARAIFDYGPFDLDEILISLSRFNYDINDISAVLESFDKLTDPLSYFWVWSDDYSVLENIWGLLKQSVVGSFEYFVDFLTCVVELLGFVFDTFMNLVGFLRAIIGFEM